MGIEHAPIHAASGNGSPAFRKANIIDATMMKREQLQAEIAIQEDAIPVYRHG